MKVIPLVCLLSLAVVGAAKGDEARTATTQGMSKAETLEAARKSVKKAEAYAGKMPEDKRNYVLLIIGHAYVEIGDLEKASNTVKRLKDSHRDIIESDLVGEKYRGDPAGGIKAVSEMEEGKAKVLAARKLTEVFLEAKDLDSARKTVELMKEGDDHRRSLVIDYLVKVDHLQEAAEETAKIKDEKLRREQMHDVNIRRILFQKQGEGRKQFVRDTAEAMDYTADELDATLARRGAVLANEGDFKAARELVNLMESPNEIAKLLREIAEALPDSQDEERRATIIAATRLLPKCDEKSASSIRFGLHRLRIEKGDATGVIEEIKLTSGRERDLLESEYIEALLKVGKIQEAIERIAVYKFRPMFVDTFTKRLGSDGNIADAELLIESLSDDSERSLAWSGLARGLAARAKMKSKNK